MFNPWEADNFPSSETTFDRMAVPDTWHGTIKLCNFFYEREGIIRTVVDKQVEIAINDVILVGESSEMEVFEYAKDIIVNFLSQAATEYFLSGLVIPDIVWSTVMPERSGLSKPYQIPQDIWVRNPQNIKLKTSPIPNRVLPLWEVPSEFIHFINNNGTFSDGTEDRETYKELNQQFPDFVKRVKKGQRSFLLKDNYIIRRKPLLRTQYPAPYLMPVLELLIHKRNLRKMDYAVASRVINAILHVRIGNDEFPITEDDGYIIDEIANEFRRRGSVNNHERVFEFFTNHTVEMDWVTPEINTLLNTDKYTELNQEILYGLGFPKFLLTGEKDKSNTGSTRSALLSPLNSMNALRRDFEIFLKYIFRKIADRNGIDQVPTVEFAPLNLIDLNDLVSIAESLYQRGLVSGTSLVELAGFEMEAEQARIKKEQDYGIKDEQENNDPEQQDNNVEQQD
jgi:hypothetical protein